MESPSPKTYHELKLFDFIQAEVSESHLKYLVNRVYSDDCVIKTIILFSQFWSRPDYLRPDRFDNGLFLLDSKKETNLLIYNPVIETDSFSTGI